MNIVETIKRQLTETFTGPAWHGPAIMEILPNIPLSKSLNRIGEGNNIAELVFHLTAWRTFAVEKLKGNASFDVTDEANFTRFQDISPDQWMQLVNNLQNTQNELLALLDSFSDEQLHDPVPGRSHDFFHLLTGVVQHDLYHLGQIVLLSKMEAA